MEIVCPHCETSYRVTPESLGVSGRTVRCVNCQNVWFEEPRQTPFQADDLSFATANPSLIRPPLDDVVEIGLTGSRRPSWDEAQDRETTGGSNFGKLGDPDRDFDDDAQYPDGKLMDGPSIVPTDRPDTSRNDLSGQDI